MAYGKIVNWFWSCHELVVQVALAVAQAMAAMDVSELVVCVA